MLVTMLPSHAGDNAAEVTGPRHDVDAKSSWRHCCLVMLVMALQFKVVLVVVRLRSPRAQSIEVLLHCEEVRYSCWLIAER
jgi:hypothetical protein